MIFHFQIKYEWYMAYYCFYINKEASLSRVVVVTEENCLIFYKVIETSAILTFDVHNNCI